MKKNQKIELDVTTEDCLELNNPRGGGEFEWTFTTDKGEDIDIHIYNPDVLPHCPRCIEDYKDEKGEWQEGKFKPAFCKECGVCKDCEHLSECSKSN